MSEDKLTYDLATSVYATIPSILTIRSASLNELVIKIDNDGKIFWHGREVETDEDFRNSMLELRDYFMGIKK